jgi:hypothetical protein
MFRSQEEVAIHTEEVAFDALGLRDSLDAVNGCRVTLGREARSLLAMHLLDFDITVIDGIGQMGGGALGLPTGNRAVIQYDNLSSFAGELVRRGQACDAGADDADIRFRIPSKRIGAAKPPSSPSRPTSLLPAPV